MTFYKDINEIKNENIYTNIVLKMYVFLTVRLRLEA